MKGPVLNKAHRYVGIIIAPFMVIQVLSGLLLDFGLFRRGAATPGGAAEARAGWGLVPGQGPLRTRCTERYVPYPACLRDCLDGLFRVAPLPADQENAP